jgi:hypothetical protein
LDLLLAKKERAITKARKIENTKGKSLDGRANLSFRFLFRVFVIDFGWFFNRTARKDCAMIQNCRYYCSKSSAQIFTLKCILPILAVLVELFFDNFPVLLAMQG